MAAATMMKCASVKANTSSMRQQSAKSAAACVAPSMSRSRSGVKPQALFIRTYGPSSCRPPRYYRSPPDLGLGLGLERTLGMMDNLLSPDWLRQTTTSVHPMEIRTFEDRYELQSDCPGMAEEDITIEVSPDRLLTITGSRRSRHNPGQQQQLHQERTGPSTDTDDTAPTAGPEAPEKRFASVFASAAAEAAGTAAEDSAQQDNGGDQEQQGKGSERVSVSYRFRRSFVLPEDADVEGVGAQLDRGVLTVRVPRKAVEKPKARRVAVAAGGGGGAQ